MKAVAAQEAEESQDPVTRARGRVHVWACARGRTHAMATLLPSMMTCRSSGEPGSLGSFRV